MTTASPSARTTQVTIAERVRAGDHIVQDGRLLPVTRVRRAQGRKPTRGENLHLLSGDVVVKVNSLDPVRIKARRP